MDPGERVEASVVIIGAEPFSEFPTGALFVKCLVAVESFSVLLSRTRKKEKNTLLYDLRSMQKQFIFFVDKFFHRQIFCLFLSERIC